MSRSGESKLFHSSTFGACVKVLPSSWHATSFLAPSLCLLNPSQIEVSESLLPFPTDFLVPPRECALSLLSSHVPVLMLTTDPGLRCIGTVMAKTARAGVAIGPLLPPMHGTALHGQRVHQNVPSGKSEAKFSLLDLPCHISAASRKLIPYLGSITFLTNSPYIQPQDTHTQNSF